MGVEDFDREEIDLLVRELMEGRRVPPKATQAVSEPLDDPASAQALVDQAVVLPQVDQRPGSRWTNVTLLMPSRPTPGFLRRFAFASAISLPQLPDLNHVFRKPDLNHLVHLFRNLGPIAMVRLWVGLGALHSASMTFWPYPKTYLWGMVLYLLSLGLVVLTGVWGARLAWDKRLGAAHTIALSTVVWAVTLAAETLPPS